MLKELLSVSSKEMFATEGGHSQMSLMKPDHQPSDYTRGAASASVSCPLSKGTKNRH